MYLMVMMITLCGDDYDRDKDDDVDYADVDGNHIHCMYQYEI